MYLTVGTRPDIAFSLGVVSRFLENPDKIHWNAVKRIFKYLKGTFDYGLYFKANTELSLVAFSDADFAGDTGTRKSTSGFVVKLGECTISWCLQRQRAVALSTTESEFVAAAQTIKHLIWLDRLFIEILKHRKGEIKVFMDNQSAIRLLKNPEFHNKSKHIDIKYCFARDKYEEGFFELIYTPTKEQIADILTKPLAREQFNVLRKKLNVKSKKEFIF
ncbi:uncharacterized protein [Prorops nasuta]|uniref:uncharacterized protein n=1 Tax=Prorops nasuta TaxID=863751 RepID=UPI0034CFA916